MEYQIDIRVVTTSLFTPAHVDRLMKKVPYRVEHLRRLPEGWHASPQQIEIAQKYQFVIPEGYTFVSPVLNTSGLEEIEKFERWFRSTSLMQVLLDFDQ